MAGKADRCLERQLAADIGRIELERVHGLADALAQRGVVDGRFVDDGTTIDDAPLRECVRETMYALELDPADIGGELTFEASIGFAGHSSDEADAERRAKTLSSPPS